MRGTGWRTMCRDSLDADGRSLHRQAMKAPGDAEQRANALQGTPRQRLVHRLQSLFIPEDPP